MDGWVAPPRSAFPTSPLRGSGRLGRTPRSCQTISHSQVLMEALTSTFALRRRENGARVNGLHTVAVTERDRLAALARAAGLRLSPADLDHLLPAWKRYVALVEEMRAAIAPEIGDGA